MSRLDRNASPYSRRPLLGTEEFARLVNSIPTKLLHPEAATFRPSLFSSTVPDTDPTVDEVMQEDKADTLDIEPSFLIGFNEPTSINYSVFQTKIRFLAQYRDFHAFFAQGNRHEAARILVNLIRTGVTPKRFLAVLLLDAIPLLEGELTNINQARKTSG